MKYIKETKRYLLLGFSETGDCLYDDANPVITRIETELTPRVENGRIIFDEIPSVRWELGSQSMKTWDYLNEDLTIVETVFGRRPNHKQTKTWDWACCLNAFTELESLIRDAKRKTLSASPTYAFRLVYNRGDYCAEFVDDAQRKLFDRFYSRIHASDAFGSQVVLSWMNSEIAEINFTAKVFQNRKGAFCVDIRSIKRVF